MDPGKNDNNKAENGDSDRREIVVPLPKGFDAKKLKVRHTKNGYFVEYETQDNNESEGYVYSNVQKIHYSETFPFKIENPEASIEDDKLIIKYKKGLTMAHNFSDIKIKNKKSSDDGNKSLNSDDVPHEEHDVEVTGAK